MITLDEAIEQERNQAKMYKIEYEVDCDYYGTMFVDEHSDKFECIKKMHEHEQRAEWLEELKVYQQHEIVCHKGYNTGYNKAIDDFVKLAKEHDFKYCNEDIKNCVIGFIEFFAEQLKEKE